MPPLDNQDAMGTTPPPTTGSITRDLLNIENYLTGISGTVETPVRTTQVTPKQAPKPVSERAARKMLADAILVALKTRPGDFRVYRRRDRYASGSIADGKTGQVWNEDGVMTHSMKCSCSKLKLGFFKRWVVGNAVSEWIEKNAPQLTPYEEEAIKLIAANKAA